MTAFVVYELFRGKYISSSMDFNFTISDIVTYHGRYHSDNQTASADELTKERQAIHTEHTTHTVTEVSQAKRAEWSTPRAVVPIQLRLSALQAWLQNQRLVNCKTAMFSKYYRSMG